MKKTADKPENTNGYVWVYLPDHPNAMSNGYIYEHRLVAERFLGRFLRSDEQVQHKDGNPHNNIISNLTLWRDDPELGLVEEKIIGTEDKDRIPEVLKKDYKVKKERSKKESSLMRKVVSSYLAKGSNT